jgi:hypothetical protein
MAKECKGSLQWLSGVKDPFLLPRDISKMAQCAHAIQAIFSVRRFFSWEYFELIDYMYDCPYGASNMKSFLELI